MDDPEVYVQYSDVMSLNMRRNYVRDRTQSSLTYILEYRQTEAIKSEGIYDKNTQQERLRAVFGLVGAIQRNIDEALQNDDMHRRKQDMNGLPLPRYSHSHSQCNVMVAGRLCF